MDWPLLVLILLTLYLGFRGYRVGLWRAIERLASLLAGYLAAFFLSGSLATVVESTTGLEGIAALLVASMTLFFGAALLLTLAFRGAGLLTGERSGPTPATRVGGAAIGMVSGVLLAVVVIWVGGFLRDLYSAADSIDETASVPAPTSRTAEAIGEVAGLAVGKALELGGVDPGVKELSTALFKSPDRVLALAIRLSRSPELAALLGNPTNHPVLDSGDINALQQLPDFQRLAAKPDMRSLWATIGDGTGGGDNELAPQLANRISNIWLRVRSARNDPRVLQILADANFRNNLEAGNPLALVNNAQLLELVQIVTTAEPAAPIPLDTLPTAPAQNQAKERQPAVSRQPPDASPEPAKIYRWTDDSGRLIYSDKPRPRH